jgi:two-component system response regulator AdeR
MSGDSLNAYEYFERSLENRVGEGAHMNKKVLVIDDDKEFLEEIKETLALSGYDVVEVNDPVLAIDVATKINPDVVLLDLKMPGKSGFQVADELKHFSALTNIPIIIMTGYFKDDYLPLLNICGIKKCLKKPFHPLDIIAQIETVLSENSV